MAKRKKERTRAAYDNSNEGLLVQCYAGLPSEHVVLDGVPSAWVASFAATRNGRFIYDEVIYVHQCNIHPMIDGQIERCLPIYHAAVFFVAGNQLSQVLLIREDYMLTELLQKYPPNWLPCRDGRMLLAEHWRRIKISSIVAAQPPERADLPYQKFSCMSLPGWIHGRGQRESLLNLASYDPAEVYEAAKLTILQKVDYVLDLPELMLTLHHDYVVIDHENKAVSMVQKDEII